ncbi:MAG: DUF3526 domain-containing protein [Bacteroidota bacterium]
MSWLSTYLYEWKHLSHSRFKLVALLLYLGAAVYGLHNGASLYNDRVTEIERIQQKAQEDRNTYLAYYEAGEKGPEDRPWVDVTSPFWAVWYSNVYHFKRPSSAMVYSIGQAEQYGYYKRVSFWASPLDADMTQEIANPERLQTSSLDFAFVFLFLQPVLLLILLYNLKSAEVEEGIFPLIEVQTTNSQGWLLSRVGFYLSILVVLNLGLLFYGALLTGVLKTAAVAFWQLLLFGLFYLLLWTGLYYLVLRRGKTIMGNTLLMAGIWLLLVFVVPAGVQQRVSIQMPANLMADFIDAKRDERTAIFNQPDSVLQAQLFALFPEIVNSPVANDSTKINLARNQSSSSLANELTKASVVKIEQENQTRNSLLRASYWFNPVMYFQNRFNSIAHTHYDNYEQFRQEIQILIDRQIKIMVLDTWEDIEVNEEQFQEYAKTLSVL